MTLEDHCQITAAAENLPRVDFEDAQRLAWPKIESQDVHDHGAT